MNKYDFNKKENRQAFYRSPEWRMFRKYILAQTPLCELCIDKDRLNPATEIHHKVDIIDRPELRLDMNNLQPLCKSCHSEITAQHSSGSEKNMSPVQLKWTDEVIKIKKSK